MAASDESQAKFIYAAISDACAVIRTIDSKVTALFVFLGLPLTKLGAIWAVSRHCVQHTHGVGTTIVTFIIGVFAISWAVGFAAALRTLLHVDNPAHHISGERPTGRFYSGDLFRLTRWSIFFSPRTDSSLQFNAFFAQLPAGDEACRKELAFELMKLVYIRSVKMKRAHATYVGFWVWTISGASLWIYHLSACQ